MILRYARVLFTVVLLLPLNLLAQGDTCTTALPVISGVHLADGPTSGSPSPNCGGGQDGDWYSYTATFDGTIIITSCHPLNNNMDDDTYLKVFSGTCDDLTCIAFNDDAGAQNCPGYGFASRLEIPVTAGTEYFIVWSDVFDEDAFYWELRECAGTVTGTTYRDLNSNGVRDTDEPQVDALLGIEPGGSFSYSGNDPYSFCSDLGSYTISVVQPPLYHTTVPATRSYTIAAQGDQITDMDFAFQPIPGMYDGAVSLWGWNGWIGNNTLLQLHYTNPGTEPIEATLDLEIDAQQSFVSASVDPTTVNGQQVSWNLGLLAPGASGHIVATIHTAVTTPPNAPLASTATLVITENDVDASNNVDVLAGIATTSFDPNDKQVNAVSITPEEVSEQKVLEYTIRFQNTGNAPAVNVVIKDSLDADWDLSTFEMTGATHPFTLTVNNEVAIWTFANIMLPDSSTDPLGSQGSLHYRMAPKNDLMLGDQLSNRADIYFDHNEPVLTNTTVTTVELNTGLAQNAHGTAILVSPSPSTGAIRLRWSSDAFDRALLVVRDALGRQVHEQRLSFQGNGAVDLSHLPDGSYTLLLQGNERSAWSRVVIQH